MICEYCGTEHPGPDVWHCGCRAAAKRKLDSLTKERDEAVRERDAYLERLRFEYKRMGTRIAALEKALRVFGRHNPDCLYHVNEPQSTVSQCTCGFSAALAGGKETK